MAVLDNVLEAFGNTPLVRLCRVTQGVDAEVYAKLEYMNPLASVKDRIGVSMVDAALQEGSVAEAGLLPQVEQLLTPEADSARQFLIW